MIAGLSFEEFTGTMTNKMVDITHSAESAIDIWDYVKQLKNDGIVSDYVFDNHLVEKVYRNDINTFDHVLLPTANENIYIIIVVDLKELKVRGHIRIDFTKLYGIE